MLHIARTTSRLRNLPSRSWLRSGRDIANSAVVLSRSVWVTLGASIVAGVLVVVVFRGSYADVVAWLRGSDLGGLAVPLGVFVSATLMASAAFVQLSSRSKEATIADQAAKDMLANGAALAKAGRNEAAIAAYDELIARLGDRPEEVIAERVAKAMLAKGSAFAEMGQKEAGIAAYDELIARLGDRPEEVIAVQVAKAMLAKGVTYGLVERPEKAIGAYDALITRMSARPEESIAEQVAKAMLAKGVTLVQLGRKEAAVGALQELVRRSDGVDGQALATFAAKARNVLTALSKANLAREGS